MSTTVVLLAVLAATLGNATVSSTIGLFGRSAGLGELEVGTIFASSAVLFLATSAAWGRLADRSGRRPVIVAGLVGTTLSLLCFAGLTTLSAEDIDPAAAFLALLAVRVLYGMLAVGTQPAALAYMSDTTTDRKRSVGAALVGAAMGLGSIAGPILAALLVGFGFAAPLVVVAALAILAALATRLAVKEIERAPATQAAAGAPPLKPFAPYLVFAFAMCFGFAALQPTTAFYVQDFCELDMILAVQRASLVSAAFASCSFVVQAFTIRALRLAPHGLLAIGTAICLLGIVACLMATQFHWLLAAFGIVGVGYGLSQPGVGPEGVMLCVQCQRSLPGPGSKPPSTAERSPPQTFARWLMTITASRLTATRSPTTGPGIPVLRKAATRSGYSAAMALGFTSSSAICTAFHAAPFRS